jgi:hypothetical protein
MKEGIQTNLIEQEGRNNSLLIFLSLIFVHLLYYLFNRNYKGNEELKKVFKKNGSKVFRYLILSAIILSLLQFISYFISIDIGTEINWLVAKIFYKERKNFEFLEYSQNSLKKTSKMHSHILFNFFSLILGGFIFKIYNSISICSKLES